ncbi:MAG TPA: hypothetical protein VFE27_12150 [Acidobacteriaceae bacterium]|nr:hypothetical protein [Acidobacteriaceae bacterium]
MNAEKAAWNAQFFKERTNLCYQPASVNHYDFGIENFNADAMRAKLTELNLKFSGTSQESFKFNDPDGFLVQVNGPDYVGHV